MQIFEFHFNPKNEDGVIFDSFCFEPQNVYEKRMGGLYMIGLLKNILPQNIRFLDKLVRVIREKYYKTISSTPEKSLKESLKKANDYLEQIAKEGDVSWLGNLDFGVVAAKNQEFHFTKTGDLKIVLMRKGHVVDIDEKLKFEGIEPFPLKVFGNIVSGKLAENDIILISTKGMYDLLFQEKVLADIARISISYDLPGDIKQIKESVELKKEKLLKGYGVCLIIVLSKEKSSKQRETLIQKKPLKIFSIKKTFAPLIERLSLVHLSIKKPTIKIPRTNIKIPKIKISFKNNNIKLLKLELSSLYQNKKLILIASLALFLILGFYIFK
jgi:hypothetical protein